MSAPIKRVTNPTVINEWLNSKAYSKVFEYILWINKEIKGMKITDSYQLNDNINLLLNLLSTIEKWADEIEPFESAQRFGNKAYRVWHQKLQDNSSDLIENLLSGKIEADIQYGISELTPYLMDSFGNPTRIDYGTGHELAFIAFLRVLFDLNFLSDVDLKAVGLVVFDKYITLARKLQVRYRMEPAGSHGVWCLDDFQFIPFLWGSSQLIGQNKLTPANSAVPQTEFEGDYHYASAIGYIYETKTGPFSEHSNQLFSISGVPTWEKINHGLIRMYKDEVLSKFPIIQHFYFGDILSFDSAFKKPNVNV